MMKTRDGLGYDPYTYMDFILTIDGLGYDPFTYMDFILTIDIKFLFRIFIIKCNIMINHYQILLELIAAASIFFIPPKCQVFVSTLTVSYVMERDSLLLGRTV